MFSLQRLLGNEAKFFDLLEAGALEARASVRALAKLSPQLAASGGSSDLAEARRKHKQIAQEISAAVYSTFITAIEREDIEALSNALYKISKTAEKFTERALMAPQHVRGVDFSKQVRLLEQASDIVLELVKAFRESTRPQQIKELNDKLQFLEAEADKHMVTLYQELYSGKYGPVQAVLLKDLYELLERMIDRCRSAGRIISHSILKNS